MSQIAKLFAASSKHSTRLFRAQLREIDNENREVRLTHQVEITHMKQVMLFPFLYGQIGSPKDAKWDLSKKCTKGPRQSPQLTTAPWSNFPGWGRL